MGNPAEWSSVRVCMFGGVSRNHGLGAVLPPEIRAGASPIMHPFGVTVTGFIGRGGRAFPGARTTSASPTSPAYLSAQYRKTKVFTKYPKRTPWVSAADRQDRWRL